MKPNTTNKVFWNEWARLGQELLDYGEEIQYGNSFVEVKFQHGTPAVILHSRSIKKIYPDNQGAKLAIAKVLEDSEKGLQNGARTFTVAFTRGKINHVQLDEYSSDLIQ